MAQAGWCWFFATTSFSKLHLSRPFCILQYDWNCPIHGRSADQSRLSFFHFKTFFWLVFTVFENNWVTMPFYKAREQAVIVIIVTQTVPPAVL